MIAAALFVVFLALWAWGSFVITDDMINHRLRRIDGRRRYDHFG